MNQVLNPARVEEIFLDCLFKVGEDESNPVMAPGVTSNVGFDPGRVKEHQAEIEQMIDELSDDFKMNGRGGASFLNACIDRHGNQWTGEHRRMEQLVQLGIATGKVEYLLPKTAWDFLPGSMPYIVIK